MMKTTSLTLILCLVGSAVTVTAQEDEWSRVRELEPGTEIAVTLKGSPPGQRYFLAGDNLSLTVLEDAAPGIAAAAKKIVVQIPRERVAEISVRERRVGKATGWGAAIGGGAGLVAGLVHGRRRCRARNCDNFPPLAFGMVFSMFGGGIGSGVGAIVGAAKGKIHEVLYRAEGI